MVHTGAVVVLALGVLDRIGPDEDVPEDGEDDDRHHHAQEHVGQQAVPVDRVLSNTGWKCLERIAHGVECARRAGDCTPPVVG